MTTKVIKYMFVVRIKWVLPQRRTKGVGRGWGADPVSRINFNKYLGQQGWHSGESTRLPPIFQLGTTCGSSLLLVLALLRGFFSGFSGFPPSKKTSPNSNSTRIEDLHENQLRLMWLLSKYLPMPRVTHIPLTTLYSSRPKWDSRGPTRPSDDNYRLSQLVILDERQNK